MRRLDPRRPKPLPKPVHPLWWVLVAFAVAGLVVFGTWVRLQFWRYLLQCS